MKDRLENFLRKEGLTAVKFAEIMQVQPSSISHILSGRNNPNFEFISKMMNRFPEINPDWLISGNGEMYRYNTQTHNTIVTNVNNNKYTNVNKVNLSEDNVNKDLYNNTLHVFTNVKDDEFSSIEPIVKTNTSSDNFIPHQITEQQKLNINNSNFVGSIANSNLSDNTSFLNSQSKSISRVIIFYSDGTFSAYNNE